MLFDRHQSKSADQLFKDGFASYVVSNPPFGAVCSRAPVNSPYSRHSVGNAQ
jgi:hypothetical protein